MIRCGKCGNVISDDRVYHFIPHYGRVCSFCANKHDEDIKRKVIKGMNKAIKRGEPFLKLGRR